MSENRNLFSAIARVTYACSLAMCCGIQSTITWSCKHHGHASIITWSFRARQKDKETGAHNMGTCLLARLFVAVTELTELLEAVTTRFYYAA